MPPIGFPRICHLVPFFRSELPSPVPRLPLGFEGGGAPFVVGEGFQRGPPRNRSPLAAFFPSFLFRKRKLAAKGKLPKSSKETILPLFSRFPENLRILGKSADCHNR